MRSAESTLVTAAVALGSLSGTGFLFVPRRVDDFAGPLAPAAYLLATVVVVALALSYAAVLDAARVERAGTHPAGPTGEYGAVSRVWGSRLVGFLAVWPKPVAYAALLALLASSLGATVAAATGVDVPRAWALLVLALALAVHLAGPAVAGRAQVALTGAFALFVGALVLAALPAVTLTNFDPLLPTPSLRERPLPTLGRATLAAVLGFVGFETVTVVWPPGSGRGWDVERARAGALVGGVVAAGTLAVLVSAVVLGVIPWSRLVFAAAPLADAAAPSLGVSTSRLVAVGAPLGTAAALLALLWLPSRTLADLGELLPGFGRTTRSGAPAAGLVLTGGGAGLLVATDAVALALPFVLPALFLSYAVVGASAAALPFLRPGAPASATPTTRPTRTLLAVAGFLGAVASLSVVRRAFAVPPVDLLAATRHGPLLGALGPAGDALVVEPGQTAVPALLGWTTLGVAVYLVAGDYRAASGTELAPLAFRRFEDAGADGGAPPSGGASNGISADEETVTDGETSADDRLS